MAESQGETGAMGPHGPKLFQYNQCHLSQTLGRGDSEIFKETGHGGKYLITPTQGKLKQEDPESQVSLGYGTRQLTCTSLPAPTSL